MATCEVVSPDARAYVVAALEVLESTDPTSPRWTAAVASSLYACEAAIECAGMMGDASQIPIPSTQNLLNGPAAVAAFSALPPTTQQLVMGVSAEAQTAQGAVNLATTIASGSVPTDTEVVTGLASVATIAGGPLIGAAMAAAGGLVAGLGSVLQAVFADFGWYDKAWTTYAYNGLLRTGSPALDPVPYGPGDPAATWINLDGAQRACSGNAAVSTPLDPIARFLNFYNFLVSGEGGGSVSGLPFLCSGAAANNRSIPGFAASSFSFATEVAGFGLRAMFESLPQSVQRAINAAQWSGGGCNVWGRTGGTDAQPQYGPYTLGVVSSSMQDSDFVNSNGFELFVNALCIKNATLAANGQAFVPPQILVVNAAVAWNAAFSGSCPADASCAAPAPGSSCYQARNNPNAIAWTDATGGTTSQNGGSTVPLVATLLGGVGDQTGNSQDAQPVCVNQPGGTGATSNSPNAPAGGGSGASAAGTAAAVGIVAAGAVATVALVHPPALAWLKGVWQHLIPSPKLKRER